MAWDKRCKDCQYGKCSTCNGDGKVWGMFGNCTKCHGYGGSPCARHR